MNKANSRSTHLADENPQQEENHKDSEHLDYKPAVAADSAPVFEQLSLRSADVRYDILGIRINSLDHLSLLGNHFCQLCEYTPQFMDGGFDGRYGIGTTVEIRLVRRLLF